MYEVPYGQIVIKPEAAKGVTDGGLFIPESGKEAPPKGVCVLRPDGYRVGSREWRDPIMVEVGDTVHHKPYVGFPIPLLMPGAKPVHRCRTCNARDDEFGLPKLCPRNPDASTGAYGPHEFEEHPPEPEDYLILDLKDVLLVERATIAPELPVGLDLAEAVV